MGISKPKAREFEAERSRDVMDEFRLSLIDHWNQMMSLQERGPVFITRLKYMAAELTFLCTQDEKDKLAMLAELGDEHSSTEKDSQPKKKNLISSEILPILTEVFATRVLTRNWRIKDNHYWNQGDAGIAVRHWLLRSYSEIDPTDIGDYYHWCRAVYALLRNTKENVAEEVINKTEEEKAKLPLQVLRDDLAKWEEKHKDFFKLIITNKPKLIVKSLSKSKEYIQALIGIRNITASSWRVLEIADIKIFQIYMPYMKEKDFFQFSKMGPGAPSFPLNE